MPDFDSWVYEMYYYDERYKLYYPKYTMRGSYSIEELHKIYFKEKGEKS